MSACAAGALVWLPTTGSALAAPSTRIVGNTAACTGAQYTTISAAVTAASPGDTIKVCAGTYAEKVDVNKDNLTFKGAQAGINGQGRTGLGPATNSIVANSTGDFVIDAENTVINGFTIRGAHDNNAPGVLDISGHSGLKVINSVVRLNAAGILMNNADPQGTQPADISRDNFINNNAGGNPGTNGNTGTGIFVNSGPANNTLITYDSFSGDSQTAVNFAGDASRPSHGLVVADNTSTNDSTFVVATDSVNALIESNTVTTSANVPGGGHGSGILDFGSNTALRISNNQVRASGNVSPDVTSAIRIADYSGTSSTGTSVTGNSVSGFANGVKVSGSYDSLYVSGNAISGSGAVGILVGTGSSGNVITHNTVTNATTFSCEDDTTGDGTAGTADYWLHNSHTGTAPSKPLGICPGL